MESQPISNIQSPSSFPQNTDTAQNNQNFDTTQNNQIADPVSVNLQNSIQNSNQISSKITKEVPFFPDRFQQTTKEASTSIGTDPSEVAKNSLTKEIEKRIAELRAKRKKVFGTKIKKSEWEAKNLVSVKENEVDIISYLNQTKVLDLEDLKYRFNINPTEQEEKLLESIVEKNPMINIRRRDKDFLLRIKIRKTKYNRKFKNVKQAQELRNILLLYSMINDPKFILHLTKRNRISEANQKKGTKKALFGVFPELKARDDSEEDEEANDEVFDGE